MEPFIANASQSWLKEWLKNRFLDRPYQERSAPILAQDSSAALVAVAYTARAMKFFRSVCLFSLVDICSAGMQAQSSFTVGTATAGPCQKATGTLEVPARADPAASIPIVVIRGNKPGPVLALVSGAHGTEYASIIALEKVFQSLDPAQVSGTVIILPLVNVPSFEQKVPHVNPVDGKSMNRFYPGKQDGTQTERVSYAITKQVVERCDYLVDYHGGDIDENLRPYSYWPKSGDAKHDAITRDMVLAFGLDHIIVCGEAHLRRVLLSYAHYYNGTRTHRSLDKDAPISRPIQPFGALKSHPILGGLHHHYVRT